MEKYTVYFEIFGKKMKWTTEAHNRTDAIERLKAKLAIVKVEKMYNPDDANSIDNSIFDFLNGLRRK